MQPWRAITRMLSILAIIGLVLAPFTVPAVADGLFAPIASAASSNGVMPVSQGVVVTGEPCCIPARPFIPESPKACPLAAMCHAKIVEGVSIARTLVRWSSPAQVSMPGNDATPDTLPQAPPSRPPQA